MAAILFAMAEVGFGSLNLYPRKAATDGDPVIAGSATARTTAGY